MRLFTTKVDNIKRKKKWEVAYELSIGKKIGDLE